MVGPEKTHEVALVGEESPEIKVLQCVALQHAEGPSPTSAQCAGGEREETPAGQKALRGGSLAG